MDFFECFCKYSFLFSADLRNLVPIKGDEEDIIICLIKGRIIRIIRTLIL